LTEGRQPDKRLSARINTHEWMVTAEKMDHNRNLHGKQKRQQMWH